MVQGKINFHVEENSPFPGHLRGQVNNHGQLNLDFNLIKIRPRPKSSLEEVRFHMMSCVGESLQ